MIIERVTVQPFRDYVAAQVFRPASMTMTGYDEGAMVPDLAHPYTKNFGPNGRPDPDTWHKVELPPSRLAMSSGGGTSTAPDLTRFMNALLMNGLLTKPMKDSVLAQRIHSEEGGRSYGLESGRWNGVWIVGHNGFAPGVLDQVDAYPDLGYVVVVLSNGDTSGAGAVS
ncbi:MAG: beta-lactamase family protein, partial [Gemmatimonadaceae bacterium]|nr:beta-lactamase family protein [Gemmatimonadaceae bacterium]